MTVKSARAKGFSYPRESAKPSRVSTSYVQVAARARPLSLVLEPRFWLHNFVLILAGMVGLSMVALLFPQTYPKEDLMVTGFSLAIHSLAIFGALYAVMVATRIDVDDALAQRVGLKATQELDKIRGGLVARIKIGRLESLIPNNIYWDRGMVKLFNSVLRDAQDRRISSTAEAMRPYLERSVGELFFLQNLQRTALHLGILGTFIGLVFALSYLEYPFARTSERLEGRVERAELISVESLANTDASARPSKEDDFMPSMMKSLHLSFCTSIAGLQASVVLGLFMMALRRRQEIYFDHMEAATSKFVSLSRKIDIADEYLIEFEQIRESIRSHEEAMQGQTRVVKAQTEEIRTGLDRLLELKKTFNDFLEDIRGEQGYVLSEMKSVYHIISPKKVAEDLEKCLEKAIQEVSIAFNSDLRKGLEELDRYNDSLDKLRESMEAMKRQAEAHAQEFSKSSQSLNASSEQLSAAMEQTTSLHGDMLARLEEASRLDVDAIFRRLQRLLDDQCNAMRQGNHLLSIMAAKPTFIESVFVRPWQSLRSFFQ